MDEITATTGPSQASLVWQQALDWFMRVRAKPDDRLLRMELDRWLAEDREHRRAYRKAERVWLLTGIVEAPEARDAHPVATAEFSSASGTSSLRLAAAPQVAQTRRSRRWNRGWGHVGRVRAAAAGIAIAGVLALLPIRLWVTTDYRTGIGETRSVSLPDGSIVQLNANSAVSLTFNGRQRGMRLLKGEAFFEVTPDAARPFKVIAADTQITVVGTAFDVKEHGDTVGVDVEHGLVAVRELEGPRIHEVGGLSEIRLAAGERVWASRDNGLESRTGLPPQRVATWRSGRLVVDGATVAEVVDVLDDYHHGVILVSSVLKQQRVTGIYDLLHPEEALRSIAQSLGADLQAYGPYVLNLSAH